MFIDKVFYQNRCQNTGILWHNFEFYKIKDMVLTGAIAGGTPDIDLH